MTTATQPAQRPVKKVAAKKSAKKAAKKAPAAKPTGEKTERKLSDQRIAVLKFVAKKGDKGASRVDISNALNINSGFCGLLGHADTSKTEPGSLAGMGLLKVQQHEGEPVTYVITAAGRKAIA